MCGIAPPVRVSAVNFCDKLKSVSKSKNNNEFPSTIYEHIGRGAGTERDSNEYQAADGTRRVVLQPLRL